MRKDWLTSYVPRSSADGTALAHGESLPVRAFINEELIEFSIADNIRSIPALVDGLKPGQRKILWSCFKRNLVKEIKVAQLGGFVSEHASYHHGETSLYATIINMAANFTGSNNLNLLFPSGQFGTRHLGGKDSASARYIFTRLTSMARLVYHPHDDALLRYRDDDGLLVEPEHYVPVLPMVLINGSAGVGTGFSTKIPSYDPRDIIRCLYVVLQGDVDAVTAARDLVPWVRGFSGTVTREDSSTFVTQGRIAVEPSFTGKGKRRAITGVLIDVEELPFFKWTQKYKEWLSVVFKEKKFESPHLRDVYLSKFTQHHQNDSVHFKLYLEGDGLTDLLALPQDDLLTALKLKSKVSTRNMHLFDAQGAITRFDNVESIFAAFYHIRLHLYHKRKDYLTQCLEQEVHALSQRVAFIQAVVDGRIILTNRTKQDITQQTIDLNIDRSRVNELLRLPLTSLTREDIEKLNKQRTTKEEELLEIEKLSPQQIWIHDLQKIEQELNKNGLYQS